MQNQTESKLMNIAEAASALNVSSSVVRTWLCKGKVIPKALVIKLGRRTLFHRQDMDTWINNHCQEL